MGDPDAVAVGDYHLKNVVGYALAGEARATDERMLELLTPYAGQRGRVIRALLRHGHRAPNSVRASGSCRCHAGEPMMTEPMTTAPSPTADAPARRLTDWHRVLIVGMIAYVVSRLCVLAAAGVRAAQMVVDSRTLARLGGTTPQEPAPSTRSPRC